MANCTDFRGWMAICGKDKKETEKVAGIVYDFMEAIKSGYTFFPFINKEDIKADESSDWESWSNNDGTALPFAFSTDGEGVGRWGFENNIDSFGKWMESELEGSPEKLEYLKGVDFGILFGGYDIDPACAFLHSINGYTFHERNTALSDMKGNTSVDTMDYTVENVADVLDCSEEEAEEIMGF